MLRTELEAWCAAHSLPVYRARQLWRWLYRRHADAYAQMSDIPAGLRAELAARLPLNCTRVQTTHRSGDGTEKRLVALSDGAAIETVWIPMGAHATVCVSTQIGCPIQCAFCASGADGITRNLSTAEIVEQVWHAGCAHPRSDINNLVFMGSGEPLLNYAALLRAIAILNDEHGLCLGARRMTISTVGVPAGIRRLASDAPQVNLAVSLHAATDALRARLIAHCPSRLDALMESLRAYYQATRRRVTFEYVLLRGVNDGLRDAARLCTLIAAVPCKVNVIAYNPVPGAAFQPPLPTTVQNFVEYLCARKITAIARRRKGDDIAAACGQLRRRHAATHAAPAVCAQDETMLNPTDVIQCNGSMKMAD